MIVAAALATPDRCGWLPFWRVLSIRSSVGRVLQKTLFYDRRTLSGKIPLEPLLAVNLPANSRTEL